MKPLCIDLFAGLGGWTEGFLAEGYDVVGFDIERHVYGDHAYPAQLVLQDVLTIHGSQFKNAAVIVASPPCQNYSWLAMPWSRSKSNNHQRAKAMRREWETNGPDNRLFDACFRIQREACEAAGRYIPLIVENVRGAQEWVGATIHGLHAWMAAGPADRWKMGRSAWNYGSFHLWGDIPALMPFSVGPQKNNGGSWFAIGSPGQKVTGENPDGRKASAAGSWFRERNGVPQPGIRHEDRGVKVESLDGGRRTDIGKGARFTSRDCGIEAAGLKQAVGGGDWFNQAARDAGSSARLGSKSKARKAASAQIAKIPFPLSSHIARCYYPRNKEQVA